ncbi:porin [Vibrio navarrensis]|uniref:porin n=1 Tax=Vibrio navarrensis TaxID=29495 RepID=UPI00186A1814|nr:porin [Vibrio navarrensis]MBE4574044.1 porin [Vibrio navarrensis]MBE4587883.1 porin [Vibrio navarrensis]
MKKTLVALAVLVAAGSVNAAEVFKSDEGSVDFYGQLRPTLKFEESEDHEPVLGTSSSRIGVNSAYIVSDSLKVLGEVELGVQTNDDDKGDSVYVRRHIFGLDMGELGTVRIGKEGTFADDVYGADYSYFFGGTALLYGHDWNNDSQIKYAYENDAFWLKAGVSFAENGTNEEIAEVFIGKSFGDLSVHAGVLTSEKSSNKSENQSFEITGEYALGKHVLGATYYFNEKDLGAESIDSHGISLAGMFAVADKTTLYSGYELVQASSNVAGKKDGEQSLLYVGVEYKFSKWARVFAEVGQSFEGDKLEAGKATEKTESATDFGLGARFYW